MSAIRLLVLTLHETYPGHHAERCCKERVLVRDRGLLEETLVLVPTPQSLVSEGIAKLAPEMLLEGDSRAALRRGRPRCRHRSRSRPRSRRRASPRAVRVGGCQRHSCCTRTGWARGGAGVSRALGADDPELAAHVIRFLQEPTSRSYILTYKAGLELARAYVAGEPERFRRLLTEQVRVGDLLEAGGGGAPTPSGV